MAQQPLVGQCRVIIEASCSHSDTPHSVGLLWTSEQPDVGTTVTTRYTHKRKTSNVPGGIRTGNPNKRTAADPRLRPRGPSFFTSMHCSIWSYMYIAVYSTIWMFLINCERQIHHEYWNLFSMQNVQFVPELLKYQ